MKSSATRTNRSVSARGDGEPIGEVLRDIPLPPYVTVEDVQFAVRAVIVHAPRRWSGETVCRNDASPHPCRLHRWGQRVLALRGFRPAEIDALIEQSAPVIDHPDPSPRDADPVSRLSTVPRSTAGAGG